LTESQAARLDLATTRQLEIWALNLLDADTLDQVFCDPASPTQSIL